MSETKTFKDVLIMDGQSIHYNIQFHNKRLEKVKFANVDSLVAELQKLNDDDQTFLDGMAGRVFVESSEKVKGRIEGRNEILGLLGK